MKKWVLVVFLCSMFLISNVRVKAGSMDSYIDWNLDRTVFAHQYRNGEDHITNLAMITADNKPAYCIEPGVTADKGSYYSSSNSISDTNLSNVDTKRLSLIGYYGYGYKGHDTKEYYMATQELIWRQMGVENVWWTDSKEGGNTFNIEGYKNEILSLVERYEVKPMFDFKKEYIVGDEVVLPDLNNVLDGYEVIDNNDVSIEGNNIKIKVKETNNNFILRRKENGMSTKFYYKSGYQTIGSFEFPYSYQTSYDINSIYGKITVDKLDEDTNSKELSSSYATLESAEYGLYDKDENLIESKITDANGLIIFDNLPKGDYVVKEINPSLGYTLNKTIYRTYLSSNSKISRLKSYEKIIKGKVSLTKILDDETLEEGIIFHVFDDDNNFILEIITDSNGEASFELSYGKYILKQITSPDKVDKIDDRNFEISEDGEEIKLTLINHRIPDEIIPTKEEINVLPNTGKNELLLYLFVLTICLLGLNYEKAYS